MINETTFITYCGTSEVTSNRPQLMVRRPMYDKLYRCYYKCAK
jgi:hypothetical protein